MSDDWKAGVDRQLDQLHGDVRLLMGALIAGFLILLGAGWAGYAKLADQIAQDRVEQAEFKGSVDAKLDRLLEENEQARAGKSPTTK